MLLWSEELGVNMWQAVSVSNSPLTHKKHQSFRIKCERYIFIKKNTPTAPLQRVRPPPNECPVNDTKQFDDEVPLMLGLWEMRSTLSLPLLPDQLWPGMVALDKTLSMG